MPNAPSYAHWPSGRTSDPTNAPVRQYWADEGGWMIPTGTPTAHRTELVGGWLVAKRSDEAVEGSTYRIAREGGWTIL